jgi:hypothetical protein
MKQRAAKPKLSAKLSPKLSAKLSPKLSPKMSLKSFDTGYWFAKDLQSFGEEIGIPSAKKLRKDELEKAIRLFLETGEARAPTKRSLKSRKSTDVKDVDRPGGLRLSQRVLIYTNDKTTKSFIVTESKRMNPSFKERSGARYRLNRWREDQITNGKAITYGDLVKEYVRLNHPDTEFKRITHGRYINFVADYLATEPNATRDGALKAWEHLKTLPIEKDYASWSAAKPKTKPKKKTTPTTTTKTTKRR